MTDGRGQIQCPVRLMAMQEYGDGGDGDMGHQQSGNDVSPPWQIEYS